MSSMTVSEYKEALQRIKDFEKDSVSSFKYGLPEKFITKLDGRYYVYGNAYFDEKLAQAKMSFYRYNPNGSYNLTSGCSYETVRPKVVIRYSSFRTTLEYIEGKISDLKRSKDITVGEQSRRLKFWEKWDYRIRRLCPHDFESGFFGSLFCCQICGVEKQES
jgi:hypothetical protein